MNEEHNHPLIKKTTSFSNAARRLTMEESQFVLHMVNDCIPVKSIIARLRNDHSKFITTTDLYYSLAPLRLFLETLEKTEACFQNQQSYIKLRYKSSRRILQTRLYTLRQYRNFFNQKRLEKSLFGSVK